MPDLFEALSIIAARRFAEERDARDDASGAPETTHHWTVRPAVRSAARDAPEPRPAAPVTHTRRRRVLGWNR